MLLRILLVAILSSYLLAPNVVFGQSSYKKKFLKENEKHPKDAGTSKTTTGIPGRSIIKLLSGIFKSILKYNPISIILKIFGLHKKSEKGKGHTAPGTKWCGPGNRAANESDLGRFEKTDACCRHHDECPTFINPGETKYGLKNTGLVRRSECRCDEQFYKCLKKIGSLVANEIGAAYFNVAKPQCFKKVQCDSKKHTNNCKKGDDGNGYAFFKDPKY